MTERHTMTRLATIRGAGRAAREDAGRPSPGWPAVILRVAGSGLLIATAAIHLDLYLTGYRTIPTIGWLFLLQVIAAFGLGLAVLAIPSRLITLSRLAAAAAGATGTETIDAVGPERPAFIDLVRFIRDAVGSHSPVIRVPGPVIAPTAHGGARFHNLRHSLASFLVRIRTDPKTVQTLLRHSDVKLTLQCYTHSVSEDRMAAAGAMLTAIFSHAAARSGLKAD